MTYTEFLLICSVIILCSVLSFAAGRSGRKVRIVTIKQFDIVSEQMEIPSKRSELFEDEDAFVPKEE